jgi:hypothetical protein
MWMTYFGAMDGGEARAMFVDKNNNIWITGSFQGSGLPVTETAIVKTGYGVPQSFISRFNPSGFPDWVSYYAIGGDFNYHIVAGQDNKFIFCGESRNADFPVTHGAFQEVFSPQPSDFDATIASVDLNISGINDTNVIIDNLSVVFNYSAQSIMLSTGSENEFISSVEITGLTGQALYIKNGINQNHYEISFNALPVSHSVYFISITTNKRTVARKFIY